MDPFTSTIVSSLSCLTVLGQLLSIGLIILLLKGKNTETPMHRWIAAHGLLCMFVVAGIATSGSLYLSEIALWTPCKLCWFQRIFMYPQVPLLILALRRRDHSIASSILLLSVIGMTFSSIHYSEQVIAALQPAIDPLEPCDLTGVSCASAPSFHLGYITIPLMAFTAFLMNALGSLVFMRSKT